MKPHTGNEAGTPSRDILMKMYRTIRTIRRFEEVGMDMYCRGYIRGYFHAYCGEEAIAVGACSALQPGDYIVSTHRGHGHCIAKGADIRLMMAEMFGKETGYSLGRGGSMHISVMATGNIGENGIVGGGIPIAVGIGMGIKLEQSDRVVVCFFGDGASNNGVFAESLNCAAIYRLPVIFLLENNRYAATTPVSKTALCENLSARGTGYDVTNTTIFGNDPLKVYSEVMTAVEHARNGKGPTLIETKTCRYFGHHVNDEGLYMPRDVLAEWKSHDPLDIMRRHLEQAGVDKVHISTIDEEVDRKLDEAVTFAHNSLEPDTEVFLQSIKIYDI